MATITQSTSIDCRAKELFQFFTKPSDIVSVSPTMPSLHYYSPKLLLGKGQEVHFDLSYGVFKLSWVSKISAYEPRTENKRLGLMKGQATIPDDFGEWEEEEAKLLGIIE